MKKLLIVAALVATASFTLVGCKTPEPGGGKVGKAVSCKKCGDGACKCVPTGAPCKGCGGTKATCKCTKK